MEPLERSSLIETTLKKPSSLFKAWPGMVSVVITNDVCPKCDGVVLCGYAEMGVTDFDDNYQHICANLECDYEVDDEQYALSMGARDNSGPANCPFCNREV
ncbi:MAG: hypothetical protein IPQ05_15455 [Leptospiraceae bacterium]|nr:hypothetical protein [Leptospiraceae bacterium]MBL0265214.1 hypothetical protein [Leptospiraceae bacterium]